MKFGLKQPCKECPFRKASAPGWLGPDTGNPEAFVFPAIGRLEIQPGVYVGTDPIDHACHMSSNAVAERSIGPIDPAKVQHCAGALLFLKSICKLPHSREKVEAIGRVRAIEPMITSVDEFVEHHSI